MSAVDALGTAVMAFIAVAAVAVAARKAVVVLREGMADRVRAEAYARRRAAYDAQLEQTVPLAGGVR